MSLASETEVTPLLSAIIPVHNDFTTLGRTLAGLAAQRNITPQTIEVIVIDNNSTQAGFHSAIDPYRSMLDLTVVHQRLLNHPYALCRARNLGLAIARGRWIWTLDSDCIPHAYAVHALLEAIADRNEPLAFTGERVFVNPKGLDAEEIVRDPDVLDALQPAPSASNYGLMRDRRFPAITNLPEGEHPWDMMHGGNTVFRRVDAQDVGGFDERFDGTWGYEDDEFAHRLLTRTGATAHFVEGMKVFHQESPAYERARIDRPNKAENPNWVLVCQLIPGYRDYKLGNFSGLGIQVDA